MNSFILFALVASLLSFGCTDSSKKSNNNEQASIEISSKNVSSIDIKILDASRVDKTLLDLSDNPDFYAINGKLISKEDAVDEINLGQTACAIRKRNFPLTDGKDITLDTIKSGESKGSIFWSTASSVNSNQSVAFVIMCMQIDKPMSISSMRNAIKNFIEIKSFQ